MLKVTAGHGKTEEMNWQRQKPTIGPQRRPPDPDEPPRPQPEPDQPEPLHEEPEPLRREPEPFQPEHEPLETNQGKPNAIRVPCLQP